MIQTDRNHTEKKIILDVRGFIYEHLYLLMLLIIVPVMYHMIFTFTRTDFIAHGHYIERIYQTHSLIFDGDSVANPLFSILSLLITRLLDIDYHWAMLMVMVANYLVLGSLITHRIFRKHTYYNPRVVIPMVLAILLYFPIILNPALDFRHPYGYVPVTSYHNPTVWLAKTFSLWSFFLCFDNLHQKDLKWHTYLLTAGVSVCSLLSKPNYAMGFLPVLGLLVIYLWIKRESFNFTYLLLGFFIPMTATLIWQYWINFLAAPYSTIAIQPLVVARDLALNGPLAIELLLGALFPIVVTVLYRDRIFNNKSIIFGWLQLFVGLLTMYLLTETGPHQFDGNFLWGPELSLFVLIVITANFWLDIFKKEVKRLVDFLPLVVLIIHGLYGVAYCIHCLSLG
jgi:hypothetical protein